MTKLYRKSFFRTALAVSLGLCVLGISLVVYAQNTPTATGSVEAFLDAPRDHWAYQAVNQLHNLDVLVGYPKSVASPSYVPTDHWAYQALAVLRKAGLPAGSPPDKKGVPRAMTRHEFAVVVAKLVPLTQSGSAGLTSGQRNLQARLGKNRQAQQALKALLEEFSSELKPLGVDVAGAEARLDAQQSQPQPLKAK